MTIKEAFQAVVDNSHEKSLNYAIEYAKVGLEMLSMNGYPDDLGTLKAGGLKAQCLWVLDSINDWEGELAKEVRETLRHYSRG